MFKIPVSAWIPKAPAITDEDWSKLAAAGGVSISPYGQDQITRAIVEYYRDYALAGVRLKEVVPLLKEVAETGGRLERALASLTRGNIGQAARSTLSLAYMKDHGELIEISPLMLELIKLVHTARAVSQLPPGDLGPEWNPQLLILIRRLHAQYLESGGVGRLSKAALAFIDCALRIAEIPAIRKRSYEALKSLVRQALPV
jgi:hypothetical protein